MFSDTAVLRDSALWDMVRQYRNHTSIILWGVRINESIDDDAFYKRTNEAAHELDDTRPTGGVRASKKSHLLEDVYTYNDFVHDGLLPGCEKKAKVTSDDSKPYLISEYNGHMFPTKTFDCEGRRTEHALRHANVLDAVAALIASICLAVCKLSNDTSQVVEAAQGSVLGLRFTMTVIPIIGLVATFFIFRKRYILTEEKVEEIAVKVKEERERVMVLT